MTWLIFFSRLRLRLCSMDLRSDTSANVMFGSICLYPISRPIKFMEKIWHKYGDMSSNIDYLL
jgi:hypothetical protein